MQIGSSTPTPAIGNIAINSSGNIEVAANTTTGTYTLQYKFTSPCGESNTATVTINLKDYFFIPHKFQYLHYPCFSPASYSLSVYNLPAWQDGDFGQGILINNVPINPANTTVSLAPGQTLPNGVTLNSATGQIVFPNNSYGVNSIFVVFCSLQDPSVCTPPIRIHYAISSYFTYGTDALQFNIGSNAFVASNPTNVLTNDRVDYCYLNPNSGTPAILNVNCNLEVLEASDSNVLNIDPTTGNIILNNLPIQIPGFVYYVRYRLCHPTINSFCNLITEEFSIGTVYIQFIN